MGRWARGTVAAILVGGAVALAVWSGGAGRRWGRALSTYLFDPARLELGDARPPWLRPAMAHALLGSYLEAAGPPFSLHDREALAAYADRLRALPWVKAVEARPLYPDRVDLRLELRRPQAATIDAGGKLCLYAADGCRLDVAPAVEALAPEAELLLRAGSDLPLRIAGDFAFPYGLPLLLGASRDAAAGTDACSEGAMIVAEAQSEFWLAVARLSRPSDGEPPLFLGVDLSQAGRAGGPEFSLVVRAADGGVVRLAWGHSPRTRYKRIPSADKAAVFVLLRREHPGLSGVAAADLRFRRRWRDRVVLREPPGAAVPADIADR
jgi:hypothetical protein